MENFESIGELEQKLAAWRTADKQTKNSAEAEVHAQYLRILNDVARNAVESAQPDENGLPGELRFSDGEKLFVNYGFFS
ncbi:hypothetical protein KY311_00370, partial [Candidatus Woesearchaeota archaeon]|nr:hypothetical protein [Candidatus Woesearchaeota archaeon]